MGIASYQNGENMRVVPKIEKFPQLKFYDGLIEDSESR